MIKLYDMIGILYIYFDIAQSKLKIVYQVIHIRYIMLFKY